MLDTDTRELTVKVEKEPVPVPGALLLIDDTVRVETVMEDTAFKELTFSVE